MAEPSGKPVADSSPAPQQGANGGAPTAPDPAPPPIPSWGQLWQGPALILGVALFTIGLVLVNFKKSEFNPDAFLDAASDSIKAGQYEEAGKSLEALGSYLEKTEKRIQARYYLLAGDSVYLQQRSKNWDVPANHKKVVENYAKAHEFGQEFDADHVVRWAQTLVSLEQTDSAMKLLDSFPATEGGRKFAVIRRIIESQLARGNAKPDDIKPLLDRFDREVEREADPALRRAQQVWAVGLRARSLIDAGQAVAATDFLQRNIVLLMADGGDRGMSPLIVMLAQAHQKTGDLDSAIRQYRLAQQKIDPSDPQSADLSAQVLVGLGQTTLARSPEIRTPDDTRAALASFAKVTTDYRSSPVYLDALIGRAACEAMLGQDADAVDHLRIAVQRLAIGSATRERGVNQLVAVTKAQHRRLFDAGRLDEAMAYLELLAPLYGDKWPTDLLSLRADTYFALARRGRAEALAVEIPKPVKAVPTANQTSAAPQTAPAPSGLESTTDPIAVARAKRKQMLQDSAALFGRAGDLYTQLAHDLTIRDLARFADSLWQAGQCYQLAELWRKAIDALAQFAKSLPNDPRQVDALYQLANANTADGQYPVAIELFKRLLGDYPQSPRALASYVPMARCYIATGQFEDAKRWLAYATSDHPAVRPDSNEYRSALVELGKLLYRLRDYEPAIERLTEAGQRYPTDPQAADLKFMLADSYRQSVASIRETLKQSLPQSRRQALAAEVARRLDLALRLYGEVVDTHEADDESLTSLQKVCRRNAYYFRADCAYELGRYDQAISLYDQAAKRFANEPSSLVAMVQIVNAYCEMGKLQEAKAVNARAQAMLKRIPREAFNDPTLPMSRQHWEDWLRFTAQFNLFDSPQANAAP